MSTYYAYLSSIRQSDVVSRQQWNALVGAEQATDDLLIGSLYPWANIISTSTSPSIYVEKNLASSWIRYYEVSGNFKNSNNPFCNKGSPPPSVSFVIVCPCSRTNSSRPW